MMSNTPLLAARLLFIFLPFAALAQSAPTTPDQGIHFETGLSWTAIQAKARTENKYIFMDCYTTWCGPCREMTTHIFPLPSVGVAMNDKFISVAVQLDTTKNDADRIKAWYQDGHDLATNYQIRAYPTYLIFSPDGQLVHRMVGSTDEQGFITEIRDAFDTTKQYYTQLHEFENGRRDTAFLRRMTMLSLDAYDMGKARNIAAEYLKTQTDLFQLGTLQIINDITDHSTDEYFTFYFDHTAGIDKVMAPKWGPNFAENKIRRIYLDEGIGRHQDDNRPPNWDSVRDHIAKRLPADADELTARIRINYYRSRKDWTKFETGMVAYMKHYGAKMNNTDLNSLAWATFEGCSDMSCVSRILDWSKDLKNSNEPEFMDTYANILYKLGKKDDAIALEQKAISMTPVNDRSDLQANLDKMKKGEKTWD
jgi:thiol-disulfide isomerase/thioredoxin